MSEELKQTLAYLDERLDSIEELIVEGENDKNGIGEWYAYELKRRIDVIRNHITKTTGYEFYK